MKIKQLRILNKIYVLILVFGVIGCDVNNEIIEDSTPDDISHTISNDETKLNERFKEMDIEVLVQSDSAVDKKGKKDTFSLTLYAEVESPVVGGVKTMATMVNIFDESSRAAVSYSVIGTDYKGGIDYLQIKDSGNDPVRVRSSIEFMNAKANAVYLGDDHIFIAHSSNDPVLTQDEGYSALQIFEYNGGNIRNYRDGAGLPGFAANSILESDDIIYVTSGNNAGITMFDFDDEDLSKKVGYIDIPDARWVAAEDDRIVVLASNTVSGIGTLYVIDADDRKIITQYTFEGADTPEAKNTVEIKGDLALVAAGRSGTHLIDLNNGKLIANIPIPNPASLGLSPDVVESNAASADEEFIFIANGEAGVYVAMASDDLDDYDSGDELTVELLGYLKFDDLQSANHVAYRDNTLIVAAGLGGVKAVRLVRK